jgi:hypothetical protein
MSIPATTRKVKRARNSIATGQCPTVLTLVSNPPNVWHWFGNDGHYYSLRRDHKTTAINDMVNGTSISRK